MTKHLVKKSELWAATLLVTGACVGGGMVALPVVTAKAGFFPSFLLLFLSWIFMALTGLLIVEASLWMEEGAHMMTMASRLLGKFGKFSSIILFLFMGYASLVGYNAGGSFLITSIFPHLSYKVGCIIFSALFGAVLYFETRVVSKINAILTVGMIGAYFGLVYTGFGKVDPAYISRQDWTGAAFAFPLILASFSYQMIVPSLTPQLKRDPKSLRFAIIVGTSLPFILYSVWQYIILGTLGVEDLTSLTDGGTVTDLLRRIVQSPYLTAFAQFFAFFAIVTSYLGISLSLLHFVKDLFKRGDNQGVGASSHALLWAMVVVPSLLFSVTNPDVFIGALEVSGGFGDSLLSALIPIAMVFVGRYMLHIEGPYRLLGGKPLLLVLALFSVYVFVIQAIKL